MASAPEEVEGEGLQPLKTFRCRLSEIEGIAERESSGPPQTESLGSEKINTISEGLAHNVPFLLKEE